MQILVFNDAGINIESVGLGSAELSLGVKSLAIAQLVERRTVEESKHLNPFQLWRTKLTTVLIAIL